MHRFFACLVAAARSCSQVVRRQRQRRGLLQTVHCASCCRLIPRSSTLSSEQNTNESFIDGLIYSELVTIDTHGNDVPDLASVVPTVANGGISKDGLTITYHILRDNARWHDGAPVTSART